MSTYHLSRASVSIKKIRSFAKENLHSYFTIKEWKSELQQPNLSQSQKEAIHLEIKKERRRHKNRVVVRTLNFIVVLCKRYNNYKTSYNIDVDEGSLNIRKIVKEQINSAIAEYRSTLRLETSTHTDTAGREFVVYGTKKGMRVFAEKNQILKAHIEKNLKCLYADKVPNAPDKYVGIELEFCAPIEEVDLAIKLFQNGLHNLVQLKRDGSLRPKDKEQGYELAVLLKESSFKQELKKVIDTLTSIKAEVQDRRCGLHVHLDMRNRKRDLVYHNFVACQRALLKLVDPKRYNSEFCKLVTSKKFPTNFTGERQERYKTINAASYYKYKTLEIRMHEGSMDYDHIVKWIEILVKVANSKSKLKGSVSKLTIFQKCFKISDKLYKHMIDRSCYWQINGIRIELRRPTSERDEGIRSTGIASLVNEILQPRQGFVTGNEMLNRLSIPGPTSDLMQVYGSGGGGGVIVSHISGAGSSISGTYQAISSNSLLNINTSGEGE